MSASRTVHSKQKSTPPSAKAQTDQHVRMQPAVDVQIRTTNDGFSRFAASASSWLGSKWAFSGAVLVIVIWAASGFVFHYSDTWQLVINTGTTIVTFLMVFLIQNTQNRDARAINLKLNELIHALDTARDQMIDIESLSDLELDQLQARYEAIRKACMAREARKKMNDTT
ncbi:MAG: low affinity iron permease family protein [Candidatus Sulfotelmatobacter sp.]